MISKKPKNRFIIAGSRYFCEKQVSKLLKDTKSDSVRYFYGDEFEQEDFFEYIMSVPIFYEENIAVLKDFDKIKEKVRLEILEKLSKMKVNRVYLLFYDEKPKEETYKKFAGDYEIFLENKRLLNPSYVMDAFKDSGISISYDTAKYIFEMCNKDPMIIDNEVEKIKIFFNYNKPKSDEDIISLLSFTKTESIYQLIRAFFSKDIQRSLSLLKVIVDEGESLERIFYELVRHIISITLYQISPSLVSEYTYTINNYKDYLAKWSFEKVSELLDEIMEIDFGIKTGQENYLSGLYRIIYKLRD
ncbi:MAG: hypothetical protein N3C60_09485 [Calditerrivibrio sp.]|nr:hypothetical protein [Calditerrivibrio sp.]